ncbi:hypothetical protein NEF87_001086 [Candidatus Lokiarchaeum ossiferum]|uniref:Nitroreductase domain-containing protein n=1 Tax=Candidatus Lokiarchaeum ossiferum TaxID=2951803 RepID=A0ABY6HMR3_9ARCH|nr:hypothetical protein NEF87_001086 [Candidatus Lokiarchaeum sp. B-35]
MVLNEIKNRRSVRKFKPEMIPDEKITEIIKAAQFAPTAMNNQAIEYIIIKEQTIKDQIFEITEPKQEFVKTAPIIIVPFTNTEKTNLATQDLSLASENIFLQAAAFGLGSVWKNCYPPVAKKVKFILNIPEKYTLINIIPIGIPEENPKPYGDFNFKSEGIHTEKYGTKFKIKNDLTRKNK